MVLLVPDSGGAAACREALDRHLRQAGKRLVEIPTESAGDLKGLAQNLLNTHVGPDAGLYGWRAPSPRAYAGSQSGGKPGERALPV